MSTNAELIAEAVTALRDNAHTGRGLPRGIFANLIFALEAREAEHDAARADLREAQQILSIVAGRAGGVFVTRAEIIAYQDGGSFRVMSEPDGLHITRTN